MFPKYNQHSLAAERFLYLWIYQSTVSQSKWPDFPFFCCCWPSWLKQAIEALGFGLISTAVFVRRTENADSHHNNEPFPE
jgi:hypothetical protein